MSLPSTVQLGYQSEAAGDYLLVIRSRGLIVYEGGGWPCILRSRTLVGCHGVRDYREFTESDQIHERGS